MNDKRSWEERYQAGRPPFDTGRPDHHLLNLVTSWPAVGGTALEIGCGTGTNALWLAQQGFAVKGIDLSPTAIERARDRAKPLDMELTCGFAVSDFMTDAVEGAPFDFVFDRGCFHCFFSDEERMHFAARVAAHLKPEGLWFSLAGSTDGPAREHGPPRCSARDVTHAVEALFEVVSLVSSYFEAEIPTPARAWQTLLRRRAEPAQPSSTGAHIAPR